MDREEFIETQASLLGEWHGLALYKGHGREDFERLAVDTYDFLIAAALPPARPFSPWPEGADNFARQWSSEEPARLRSGIRVPPDLLQRWLKWNDGYYALCARSPRLALHDAMKKISESHDASSWPDGYEHCIYDWVDAGDPSAPPPFDDRYGIATPEFFHLLRDLRQRCGGWVYSSVSLRRVVFAPEAEWKRVRDAQEETDRKHREKRQEGQARGQRVILRAAELIAVAREDAKFWESLRQWELSREAKRPRDLRIEQTLSGPIRIAKVVSSKTSEKKLAADNPPLDPLFASFIARVRKADDPLSATQIVLLLRGEVRRELGF